MERYPMLTERQNQYRDKDYSIKRNPHQNSNDILHKDRKINPKFHMEAQKTSSSQRNLEQKQKCWSYHNTRLQTILQSHSCKNSLVLAQEQAQRLMEQSRIPRNKSTHLQPSDFFTKEPKTYIGEKTSSSTNGAGKSGY
jgi:hypothetical protein